jgi:predicted acetyltransferase
MDKLILMTPTNAYSEQIWHYKKDFESRCESLAGCGTLEKCQSVEQWLNDVYMYSTEETYPKTHVPSSMFLAIREKDHKLVGIIDFRHHINHPILSAWGGHIGYSVLSSERNKGYAKEMLRQVLIHCKNKGLDKVLVTCHKENIASKRTIISNGGIYEKEIIVDGSLIERYWISLS